MLFHMHYHIDDFAYLSELKQALLCSGMASMQEVCGVGHHFNAAAKGAPPTVILIVNYLLNFLFAGGVKIE